MDSSYKQFEIREGLIFLIELSPSIFEPLEELKYKSQFQEVLSSINGLVSELIITSHHNGVGVYLYNSQETSSQFKNDSGIRKIFGLNDLNSTNMKTLNDLIDNDTKSIKTFKQAFPVNTTTTSSLPIVLNTILNEFNSKSYYNNKKLIWITNNDNPYSDENTKRRLWKIINDYDEYKINISPIFLDKFENGKPAEFSMAKFQNIFLNSGGIKKEASEQNDELLDNDDDDDDDDGETGLDVDDLDELSLNEYIHKQVQKAKVKRTTLSTRIKTIILRLKEIKRIQFSCDLILSDGAEIGGNLGCTIKGYAMYNHEKPKRYESIYEKGEVPKLVHVKTKYINENTNEEIKKEQDKDADAAGANVDAAAGGDDDDDNDEGQPSVGESVKRGYAVGESDILYLNEPQLKYLKNYTFDHTPDGEEKEEGEDEGEEDNPIEDQDNDELHASFVNISRAPYLKLLGFRKINHFKPFFNTSKPIFVTPDLKNGLNSSTLPGGFQNSFTTFSSLYQSCVSLKRYGVFFGCLKKNAIPCLYALYPTKIENSTKFSGEEQSENKFNLDDFPQGFFLIRLPWIEDIRSLPEFVIRKNGQYVVNASKEKEETFQSLVSQYKIIFNEFGLLNYQPADYPNPSLNYFYKILRSHLLQIEEEGEEEFGDSEEETKAQTNKDVLDIIKNDSTIAKLLDLLNYIYQKQKVTNEPRGVLIRGLNDALNRISNSEGIKEPDAKRAKVEIELNDTDVITAWKSDAWSNFNVSQLRGFIGKHKQIQKATKKADMIANIIKFLESKYGSIA